MVGKRKAAIPKISLRGKHLKTNNTNLEKIEPSKEIEIIILPELKHNNLGNYQKSGKKKQNTKNGETTQNKVYREPISHNEMGEIKQEDSKQKKQCYLFQSKKIRRKRKKKQRSNHTQ